MFLLVLIQDRDASPFQIMVADAAMNKPDRRFAQNLQKRAAEDALIGGQLVESGTHDEGVSFVNQGDLDRGAAYFA